MPALYFLLIKDFYIFKHEADNVKLMTDKLMANDICKDLILGSKEFERVEFEMPEVKEIKGVIWKGKADVVNHDEKLIIDLKTTGDINKFKSSAWKFNYDSQAYIYSKLFGYEFLFIVIDKNTHQIGVFDYNQKHPPLYTQFCPSIGHYLLQHLELLNPRLLND